MIRVQQITYRYKQGTSGREVLKGIDFIIQQGEWLTITGRNGSGKSTLIRMLNGLTLPHTGTIMIDGMNTEDRGNRDRIKQKVQLVFQNPDAQIIGNTPMEDVAFGLENRGIPKQEMHNRIATALKQVRLDHKSHDLVATLSGGEKQRLAIASSLALNPQYLIFDESTSMLDPIGKKEIFSIAQSLSKKGITIIWVTQELAEVVKSRRIAVFDQGVITYDGGPRELFYETDIPAKQRWDVPPMIEMGRLMKKQGIPVSSLPLCDQDLEELLCTFSFQL